MPFIDSFSINTEKQHPFPFNIPAVRFARQVGLDKRVTIFAGDNGSGKSTLLESLAFHLKIPQIGGHINSAASFKAAKLLNPYLEIKWSRQTNKGFFLSPLKQLALIAFILEVLKKGNAQFIMATHSPILMGIPGARIYEIREEGMQEMKYKETDHYRITKTFLDNPEYYLRHF